MAGRSHRPPSRSSRLRALALAALLTAALPACRTPAKHDWAFAITRGVYSGMEEEGEAPRKVPDSALYGTDPGWNDPARQSPYAYRAPERDGYIGDGKDFLLFVALVGGVLLVPVALDVVLLPVELTHDALVRR